MSNILDLFKTIGKAFASVGKFVVRFVSDAQLDIAIAIVKDAAVKFLDNEQRRAFAVAEVQARLSLPENRARWLVETAVLAVKAKAIEAIEDAGEKLKNSN